MWIEPDFFNAHVVVMGDIILDRYWQGEVSRISPEAPVPVVRIEATEERLGGAANVALNVSALGATTTLIGVVGDDEPSEALFALLKKNEINCQYLRRSDAKTTVKLRVLGQHQQLIRLDFEEPRRWSAEIFLDLLEAALEKADVLILSDYAKGVLSEADAIIDFARARGVKVVIDPKRADLEAYRGAHCLTPNLKEFEMAVGPCTDQIMLEAKGHALLEKLDLDALLITQGEQGMTLIESTGATCIPARTREVFDVTGAGDTVIAVLGAMIARQASFINAATVANVAAGIVVGKRGAATASLEELLGVLMPLSSLEKGVVSVQALQMIVQQRKKAKHTIVMTNGCFDILHAGHVTYLKEARALGDCLIVAVNDDDSVRRLKGHSRPVYSLEQRMQILAALACVDYVVAFSEDTPEALIASILPQVLVKGGDYAPEHIAGGKQVVQHGGVIKIIPLVQECSTTRTLSILENTIEEVVS